MKLYKRRLLRQLIKDIRAEKPIRIPLEKVLEAINKLTDPQKTILWYAYRPQHETKQQRISCVAEKFGWTDSRTNSHYHGTLKTIRVMLLIE